MSSVFTIEKQHRYNGKVHFESRNFRRNKKKFIWKFSDFIRFSFFLHFIIWLVDNNDANQSTNQPMMMMMISI